MPTLECSPNRPNEQSRRPLGFREEHVIPSAIIKNIKMRGTEHRKVNKKTLEELEKLGIEAIGYRDRETMTKKEIWAYSPESDRKIQIYRHKQDGLVKFMEFDKISVFFLRGDSVGEGGSGQEWFQPKIFDLIIDKIVDGGFIVTDGSGYYGNYNDSSNLGYPNNFPWKAICGKGKDTWDDDHQKPKDFNYKNRKFNCIGECGERYGTVYLWKVEKI